MAKLFRTTSSVLTIMALLSNCLNTHNLVQASFNRVDQGVVRIDLEKKYIKNLNLMLSDDIDMDKMILVDSQEQSGVEIDLILDANENNYSVLREQQRKGTKATK